MTTRVPENNPPHVNRTPTPAPLPGVPGMVALELAGGTRPARGAVAQAIAGDLASLVGRDLAKLVPEVRGLDLVLAGAHFDPAEVLRPGWPLHRRLAELRERAPGRGGAARILAFGADEAGQVPLPFQAEDELQGGSLRVLPFLLAGDPAEVEAAMSALEECLLERGMAAADTALMAQESFGARIEHARYLTVHDLAAMTAMQYGHQNLDALWPLIETALLAQDGTATLDQPPEPLVHYTNGEARIALFDPQAWCARYGGGGGDCDQLAKGFEHFQARQRQLAAVLEAHGIPVLFAHCDAGVAPSEL